MSGKPSPSMSPMAGGEAAMTRFAGSSRFTICSQVWPFKIRITPKRAGSVPAAAAEPAVEAVVRHNDDLFCDTRVEGKIGDQRGRQHLNVIRKRITRRWPSPFTLNVRLKETDGDVAETELVHISPWARAVGDARRNVIRVRQATCPTAIGVAATVVVAAALAASDQTFLLNADFAPVAGARSGDGAVSHLCRRPRPAAPTRPPAAPERASPPPDVQAAISINPKLRHSV